MKNHQDYQNVKIAYGKDRCGNPPRSVSQNYPRKASMAHSSGQTPPPGEGDDSREALAAQEADDAEQNAALAGVPNAAEAE